VEDGLNIQKIVNMKKARSINKKHHKITRDYEKQKSKHVEKLADKMLKNDEKAQQLKSKTMKGDFLKNF
jgi:hypothetical protein